MERTKQGSDMSDVLVLEKDHLGNEWCLKKDRSSRNVNVN